MDKREVRRAYKENSRPMGIYCVRNTGTGRTLVGRSADLPSALNREQAQLRFGGHPNRLLQSDWNAHGPASFAFEVLDTLAAPEGADYDPVDDLRVLEALWVERLDPFGERGYARRPAVRP